MVLEGDHASALSRRGYETLLDAAETYREGLVVRLCGEVGLRPAELARLTPDCVDRVRDDPARYLLRVPDEGGGERTAYLPTDVERELRRYVRSNGLEGADRIFTVTPRRLQMLAADVAQRASDVAGNPALAEVSTSDLRHFFARSALAAHEINPRAVKHAGGWRSFEALEPYLPPPTDEELVDAFAAVERSRRPDRDESAGRTLLDDGVVRSVLEASDRYALVRLDADGYVERWTRSAASTFGYRAGEVVGTHVSAFYAEAAVDRGVPERSLTAAREDAGWEGENWLRRADGSRFRAAVVVSALRDERGHHRGYGVLVRDASSERERLEAARSARDDLERLYAVAERFRAVTAALLAATDHEAVETGTCASLTDGPAYEFAWIDRTTVADRRRERRAASGIEPSRVDDLGPDPPEPFAGDGPTEPTVSVATDVTATLEDGATFSGALATVPLSYGETVYGALSVATAREAAFDEREREWLTTLGRQVGYAVAAVRRRNLLLSDRVLELEFACRDPGSFFVDVSDRFGCRFELDSLVPVSESSQLHYVHLEGASLGEVFDLADEDPGIADCRLIETGAEGWRVEFVVEGSSPTLTLTEYGVTVRETVVDEGTATITAECAADADLRTVVDGLRRAFPDSELVGKRETERTVQTAREFRAGLDDRLTDRQQAALRAAYFGGYYDWPRESTAEEVADAMGVSSPTLHNHLRKGQHELLRTFFDETDDADD